MMLTVPLAGGVTSLGNMAYVLPWETLAARVRAESVLVAQQAIADADTALRLRWQASLDDLRRQIV